MITYYISVVHKMRTTCKIKKDRYFCINPLIHGLAPLVGLEPTTFRFEV